MTLVAVYRGFPRRRALSVRKAVCPTKNCDLSRNEVSTELLECILRYEQSLRGVRGTDGLSACAKLPAANSSRKNANTHTIRVTAWDARPAETGQADGCKRSEADVPEITNGSHSL